MLFQNRNSQNSKIRQKSKNGSIGFKLGENVGRKLAKLIQYTSSLPMGPRNLSPALGWIAIFWGTRLVNERQYVWGAGSCKCGTW